MKTLSVHIKHIMASMSLFVLSVSVTVYSVMSAFAQATTERNSELSTIQQSLNSVLDFVSTSSVIIVGLAFLFFFYNLAMYILKGESDPNKKEGAKKNMIWAVLAIFVLTTIWGLVAFVRNIVGVEEGDANNIDVPTVDFRPSSRSVPTGT